MKIKIDGRGLQKNRNELLDTTFGGVFGYSLIVFFFSMANTISTRKEFTKEINKVKPSMKSIPFISVYNLTERTERTA